MSEGERKRLWWYSNVGGVPALVVAAPVVDRDTQNAYCILKKTNTEIGFREYS